MHHEFDIEMCGHETIEVANPNEELDYVFAEGGGTNGIEKIDISNWFNIVGSTQCTMTNAVIYDQNGNYASNYHWGGVSDNAILVQTVTSQHKMTYKVRASTRGDIGLPGNGK